ncbi:dienelactone hydrolase family protein [Bradyrhizobium sp. C-145]|uniref:dienelactone hydrolase family protein n=1 Tax=Bradyrhizobium sp. C-145 TaxID=574727 RepID=UPI00201B8633|nr:dienelactone hydrolase family protein [Bradyrhizobium sp. C-145]UQR65432.1 dienelactone hydrolase family protein [Bradyrhizobium sp. C-145]
MASRLRLCVIGILASSLASSTAFSAETTFSSVTFSNFVQAIQGASVGEVNINADLRFPSGKEGRYPAIVVAHTIGGYNEANEGWFAAELRKAGFATLTYDSIKSRKWSSQTAGANPGVNPSVLADAFAALRFLAGQPKINPQKIAVVGFSLGGDVAHMAAFERFRKAMAPDQRFAAHVAFYPAWTMGTRGGPTAYTGSPVLLLLGEKDELTPADKVDTYLAYLTSTNTPQSIEKLTYPAAYHGWTNPAFRAPNFFKDFGSARKCPTMLIGEARIGLLINGEDKSFNPTLWESCRSDSRGYSMGFSSQTRAKSLADTIAFLRRSMSL